MNDRFKHAFLVAVALLVSAIGQVNADPVEPPQFVTSEKCRACHVQEFEDWSDSHHAWAWREPTRDNVLGDFDNAVLVHNEFSYRFQTEGATFFIIADGPDGEATRYPIRYVVGVTPLQQYLVETGNGRLQTLDVTWDTERRRWYHLYPDQDTSAGNGMHWSGPYKNWNARCAVCHVTGYEKNYDPETDLYRSRQTEIGVGCEACHGPGEAHVAWAEQPDTFDREHWLDVNARGWTPAFIVGDAASEINVCAACHSRREPLGADSPPPGAAFDDHYRLALLRDGLYYPDGQIHDEVYVYGSYLQSKMYAQGVRCTNCHEPHSYALKLQGNELCTQCHQPRGNPAFPTSTKAEYDAPAHHFHEQGSDAATCRSCHMPETDYMVVDARSDHSFRVPRPDLAAKLDTPDLCTQCHQGKTPEWAAQEIRARFPQGRSDKPHFGEVFAVAGDTMNTDLAQQLIVISSNHDLPAIVRATALQLQPPAVASDPAFTERLAVLLSDDSALVRAAAVKVQRGLRTQQGVIRLATILADPNRSVRIEAAKALLGVPPGALPREYQVSLREAMGELQESMRAKADYPEGQLVIGGVALTLRDLPAATSAFRRAVEMDPQLVPAWLMLARIQAVGGDRAAVGEILKMALQENSASKELRQAIQDLGPVE